MSELPRTIEDRLADLLREIKGGSAPTGRWLDGNGHACEEGEPGAQWEPYSEEEQAGWLQGVVALAEQGLEQSASTDPALRLPSLFHTVQKCTQLTAAEQAAIAGILDAAFQREKLEPIPTAPLESSRFADLREVFAGLELPSDADADRIYLKLAPFDVKLQRTDEGLVCDIFAVDSIGESLASCRAFNSDASLEAEPQSGGMRP